MSGRRDRTSRSSDAVSDDRRGVLTGLAKLRYMADTIEGQVGQTAKTIRASLRGPATGAAAPAPNPPDTRLTRQALDFAEQVYSTELFHHCMRCWYVGDFFARLDGVRSDPEELFVACLLHDVGLTESEHDAGAAGCFAVHGDDIARARLGEWGAPSTSIRRVGEAITLHMDASVDATTPTAHLLHAGAHADVVGRRVDEVPDAVAAGLHARHSRVGFADAFLAAMRREARERPGSRAAIAWRMGMSVPVRAHPWNRRYGRTRTGVLGA